MFTPHFKQSRASAGLCGELHVQPESIRVDSTQNQVATVQAKDHANIVNTVQGATFVQVKERRACPAHDAKLWSEVPPAKWSIRKVLWRILQCLISLVYVLCPPWPPLIVRKTVFCSPPRGSYYYLIGNTKDGKKKACFYASEAVGMGRLSLCLPQMIHTKLRAVDVYYHLLRCKVVLLPFDEGQHFCAMELSCEQSIRWLHRDSNRKKKRSPNLIIFSQPNSSDLGCCLMMDPNVADIADFLQCDLLIYDYPGYGVSDGKPNETTIYASIDAIMKYAMETMGYSENKIILMGFSLGTAAMIHLAEKHNVAALILIAPFTSFTRIVLRCPSLGSPCADMFPSLEKAGQIRSPTLICHGQRDIIVSHRHGIHLQQRIPNSQIYLIEHASHQGIFCEREMWDQVERFLSTRVGVTQNWVDCLGHESSYSEVSEVATEPRVSTARSAAGLAE